MNNFILGGGVAGLLSAFYNDDYYIITDKIGGWQNLNKFDLGPRLLEVDEYTTSFMNKLNFDCETKQIKIGYIDENDFVLDFVLDKFKIKYANKTRELLPSEIHNSVLSSGKNTLTVFDIDYNIILEKIENICNDRIIIDKITSIDIDNNEISSNINKLSYNNLINTIPITIFNKISNISDKQHDFTAFNTTFFKCKYDNYLSELKEKFNYVYSVSSTHWHRCNLLDDYVVFEVKGSTNILMDKYKVLDKVTIPYAQIKYSYNDIKNTGNRIIHIGRYAQWNHSIKMQQIIGNYEKNR